MLAYQAVGIVWMLYSLAACGWLPICALLVVAPDSRRTAKRFAGGMLGMAPGMALLQIVSLPVVLLAWWPAGGFGIAFRSHGQGVADYRWVIAAETVGLVVFIAATLVGLQLGWTIGTRLGQGTSFDESAPSSSAYRFWARLLDRIDDRRSASRRHAKIAALSSALTLGVGFFPALLVHVWLSTIDCFSCPQIIDPIGFFEIPDISGRWAALSPKNRPSVVSLTLRRDGTGTLTAWFQGDPTATEYEIDRTIELHSSFDLEFRQDDAYRRHPIVVVGDILETALPVQIKTLRNRRVVHLMLWRARDDATREVGHHEQGSRSEY